MFVEHGELALKPEAGTSIELRNVGIDCGVLLVMRVETADLDDLA